MNKKIILNDKAYKKVGTVILNDHSYDFIVSKEEPQTLKYIIEIDAFYYQIKMNQILQKGNDSLIKEQYLLNHFVSKVKANIDAGLYENREILEGAISDFSRFCSQDKELQKLLLSTPGIKQQEIYKSIKLLLEYFDKNYEVKHSLDLENIQEVKKDDKTYVQATNKDGKVIMFNNTDSKYNNIQEEFKLNDAIAKNNYTDDPMAGIKNANTLLEDRERRQKEILLEKEEKIIPTLLTTAQEQEKKYVDEYARKNNLDILYKPEENLYYDKTKQATFVVRTNENGLFQIEYLDYKLNNTENINGQNLNEKNELVNVNYTISTEEDIEKFVEDINFDDYSVDVKNYKGEDIERIAYSILYRMNIPDYLQREYFEKILDILNAKIENLKEKEKEIDGMQYVLKNDPKNKANYQINGFVSILILSLVSFIYSVLATLYIMLNI